MAHNYKCDVQKQLEMEIKKQIEMEVKNSARIAKGNLLYKIQSEKVKQHENFEITDNQIKAFREMLKTK
jgi:hypothetical protein